MCKIRINQAENTIKTLCQRTIRHCRAMAIGKYTRHESATDVCLFLLNSGNCLLGRGLQLLEHDKGNMPHKQEVLWHIFTFSIEQISLGLKFDQADCLENFM